MLFFNIVICCGGLGEEDFVYCGDVEVDGRGWVVRLGFVVWKYGWVIEVDFIVF